MTETSIFETKDRKYLITFFADGDVWIEGSFTFSGEGEIDKVEFTKEQWEFIVETSQLVALKRKLEVI